jgi:hypothetical protein
MRAEGDVVFEVLNHEGVPVILSRETWQAKDGDGEIGSHQKSVVTWVMGKPLSGPQISCFSVRGMRGHVFSIDFGFG